MRGAFIRVFELLLADFQGNNVEMSISNMLRRLHQISVPYENIPVRKVDEIGLLPVSWFFRSRHDNGEEMLLHVGKKMDFFSVASASGGFAYLMCRINFGSSRKEFLDNLKFHSRGNEKTIKE